ncbi:MAG: hypothetical protein U5N26_11395 [Candidatus Marinimicrobia bacterium]|nr:hypothetical protein [Candidatus Neomarinimicrobiota bacterium]
MKRRITHLLRITLGLCLWVSFPLAQMLILSPEENAVTELHRIAVTVMGKPSAETHLYLNDELVLDRNDTR